MPFQEGQDCLNVGSDRVAAGDRLETERDLKINTEGESEEDLSLCFKRHNQKCTSANGTVPVTNGMSLRLSL